MYGHKYMGVERTTFIINPDGTIKKIFAKVNPAGHAAEVLASSSRCSMANIVHPSDLARLQLPIWCPLDLFESPTIAVIASATARVCSIPCCLIRLQVIDRPAVKAL